MIDSSSLPRMPMLRPTLLARCLRVLLLPVVCISAASAQSDRRPMTIVDLINVPRLSEPRLSPSGDQLLYVRTDTDWKKNGTISHIWRVNADGTKSVKMTNGAKGERNPRWSPDGSMIAFIAQRDDDKRSQLYTIPNDGGEAVRLGTHPTSVSRIAWSPDGKWIYYTAPEDKTAEEKAREKIKDNVFRYDEEQKHSHLWRIAVPSGKSERVTEGDFTVRGYNLSPDGTMIAHLRAPSPRYDDSMLSEVWVMTAQGDDAKRITDNRIAESGPALSPDNRHIVFTANTNDTLDGFYYNQRLFVVPVGGGEPRALVAGGTYDARGGEWSADGTGIYFSANTGLRQHLYHVDVASGAIAPLTSGDMSVSAGHFRSASTPNQPALARMAITTSHAGDPGEIRVMDVVGADAGEPRQVTHVFDELLASHRLPRVEAIRWKGEDGVEVEGLLYYPLDYREGTRYPLVVQTHGGPAASDKFRFFRSGNYEPVLTAMGYFVFKPNYRGSTGYGDAFLRDMVGHYFNQAHKDVMAGVDALIERGLVDGDRMAKMGWSAGGHMTNKIITYTDRFKAASSGAGAVNWVSMYGQSDVRIYRTPWFGGTPWEKEAPLQQYLADSPLFETHKVVTPTIVLVGENDARVPMPQSVELYRALRHNGVPTHLYVAPKQGHGWRELQQRLFKANVELDWFERWVRGREYTWEKSPVHPETDETAAPVEATGR